MLPSTLKRLGLLAGIFILGALCIRYLLPLTLPFFLGALLALAAEPAVRFGVEKLKLRRGLSAGLGVGLTLLLLTGLLTVLGALVVKELGSLASLLPQLQQTTRQGLALLESELEELAARSPEAIRPLLEQTAQRLFDPQTPLSEQAAGKLTGFLSSAATQLPGSAIGLGTGILAAFMVSARLPRLKRSAAALLPRSWHDRVLPAIRRVKHTLWSWLKAQFKLCLVTWGIVSVGLLVLSVSHGAAWAVLVALVDAVPLLGTGTILLPWALVRFLQQDPFQAVGLVCIYGVSMLTRTVLEPRLVGKQLGLDPLVTLFFLYIGYRFWGIWGMILAPVLAAAVGSIQKIQDS